ncbi:MAG TPA: BamA/TamA family outer membrane protein [Vicinamibacterales bacterium]|nr:BamA/TamA family outer membrane protein [Vicinamibacterales bacterium]
MKRFLRCAIALTCLFPATVRAQEPPPVPSSATEADGLIAEPPQVTRVVLFADRHFGKGDLTNGIYLDRGNMIPGAGLSIGPGYRQWFGKDSLFVDASTAVSINSYRMAQARVEMPKLLKSRLAVGAHARWQDFQEVAYYGVGAGTVKDDRSAYAVESNLFGVYATLRPFRWMDIGGEVGWMNPEAEYVKGPLLRGVAEKRTLVPVEASVTIDTRDFPGHPTQGVFLRGAGMHYSDRTDGSHTFNRYDAEAAGFLPLFGSRVVLAAHGLLVNTDTAAGRSVPLYLQPSLGGADTLRSFGDFRFRDDSLLLATAEMRLALMTHLDLAMFADAGNVAPQARDLNLDKRSYGAGLRLHTRRETFAMIDVARGSEGWRFLFRLKDPMQFARLTRKSTFVPFVP